MQIEVRFRRRATDGGDVPTLNARIIKALSGLKGFWRPGDHLPHLDKGEGESASIDLTPCLENGIRGAISYASRLKGGLIDKAISDDVLTLKINAADYEWFGQEIFAKIVLAFEPYRAGMISDLDQDLDDFEDIVNESRRTGLDVDGRDTIFRIQPISYFDDILCCRAFCINSDEALGRMSREGIQASKVYSGVLIQANKHPLNGRHLIEFDARVRRALSS